MQKSWRKTTKIGWWSLEPTRRGRKEKNYLKSKFGKVQIYLLKNLIHEFWSVENRPRSVETDRDSLSQILKILKISIGRKTEWTNRIRQRLTTFLRKNTIFEKQDDLTQSNKNAWVWDDIIFKSRILSPIFPKPNFLHSPQIFKQQI